MVERLTYQKRHNYATKSNQTRVVKTPGGRLVYQYTKKSASGPKCPVTGKKIQGTTFARTCLNDLNAYLGSDGVLSQSQVTPNLPDVRLSSKIAIYTRWSTRSPYALMVTPIATTIEERIVAHGTSNGAVTVKKLQVLSTVVVAIVVPFFGYLMALIGSVLCVVACMTLPCAFYLRIFRPTWRDRTAKVTTITVILVVALLQKG